MMKTNRFQVIFTHSLLVLPFVTSMASAQTIAEATAPVSQTNVMTAPSTEQPSKTFSVGLGIEYAQRIAKDEQAPRESTTDYTLAPGYKFNDRFQLATETVFEKENSGAGQSSVSNTKVGLGIKGYKFNDSLESTHSLVGIIPTNEDSQKRDRLQGGVSVSAGLLLTRPYFSVEYKLALARNFHEFDINAEGNPNIEYTLGNSLQVIIPFTDKFSISSTGLYKIGQTYQGFNHSAFEISGDMNYNVTEQLSVNVGTTNNGDALRANGVDSNIDAYNPDTSVWRVGISLTI